jgi:hypothetical protein
MRNRIGILGLLFTAVISVLGTVHVADAGQICVGYSVTAPIVGTRQNTRCVNEPFNHEFSGGNCQGVPPLGVEECITFRVDLP